MHVLGRTTSINVQKVLWIINELDLPHDQQDLGGAFGGLDSDEYGAMNPTRKVPTLQDGDLVLYESNAIVRYLAANHGGGVMAGEDTAQAARADMWMEWYQNNLNPHITTLFHQTVRMPQADRDPAMKDRALAAMTDHLAIAEAQLAKTPFIVGERLTMGDIPLGACLHRYYTMQIDRPDLPRLAAYFDRLGQSQAYRRTVMTSYESLRAKD
jgi:glutathione S-transferase